MRKRKTKINLHILLHATFPPNIFLLSHLTIQNSDRLFACQHFHNLNTHSFENQKDFRTLHSYVHIRQVKSKLCQVTSYVRRSQIATSVKLALIKLPSVWFTDLTVFIEPLCCVV